MTNLKDIQFGMNKYCGPAFLSAITGKDTDECARIISEVSGKREIKAVELGHLIKALNKMRFDAEKQKVFSYSLYGNIIHILKKDGMYLVMVPHHFVAVEVKSNQVFLVDNHTRQPIDAASSARLIQRVDAIYKIIPRPEKKFIRTELLVEDKNGYVDIKAREIYEPEEDTTEINLGYVRFRNEKEFHDILTRLWEIGGRK